MASANGSAGMSPAKDDAPDRARRIDGMQEVVRWFGAVLQPTAEHGPLTVMNRKARRMNKQLKEGKPTTGQGGGCPLVLLAPAAAIAVLVGWAVR